MKKLKLVSAILLIALTLEGCGLVSADSEDVEPNTKIISKPDEPDPGKG
jgi:PBP1b-binding outer membrane lipoprotein LpoB